MHPYDSYASVQDRYFNSLKSTIQKISPKSVSSIIDIGCATGKNTIFLQNQFIESKVLGIDLDAERILETKKISSSNIDNIQFQIANMETFNYGKNGPFDIIFSNAALHWAKNTDRLISNINTGLAPTGNIILGIFGNQTYHELQFIINQFDPTQKIQAQEFTPLQTWAESLSEIFTPITSSIEILKIKYTSLKALFKSIQQTNTTGKGIKLNWTPSLVQKMEILYIKNFGGIWATHEVLLFHGKKKE